jgi:hypothetical protein
VTRDQEDLAAFKAALNLTVTPHERMLATQLLTVVKNRLAQPKQPELDEDAKQRHSSRLLDKSAWGR